MLIPVLKEPINAAAGDTASVDAFSRLRVSDPVGLFASQCQYDADPLLFEAGATAHTAPAHSATTRMVEFTSNTLTGSSFMQSYEYVPYQPGKSQLVFVTGILRAGVASSTVDVGLFDAANGIFLRQNGATNLQIIRRIAGSDAETIAQPSWNLDRLDGTGPSGVTLDVTKVFILIIDAQFLGMGRVRIGFDIGGVVIYVHQFLNANSLTTPYMQTLTLPVQMLLTTSADVLKTCAFKCASVSSEGGFQDDAGYDFATPEQTVTAASGARTHIISLRPRTTFNSLTNRSRVKLDSIEMLVTGNQPVFWELCVGSTFSAGPTFANVNATYSACEYSSAVGTLSAAGIVIASGYCAASNQTKSTVSRNLSSRYPITLNRAGAVRANGTLSLLVSGIGGTSATRASFNFSEIR